MSNILKNKNLILIITAAVFLLAYTLIAANMSRGNYAIQDLKKEISQMQKNNNELQLELSKVSSLDFVLEESERLSYEDIERASYIQKPTHSPFASR